MIGSRIVLVSRKGRGRNPSGFSLPLIPLCSGPARLLRGVRGSPFYTFPSMAAAHPDEMKSVSQYSFKSNACLAYNYICEQDGRKGKSGSSHAMSLVPGSVYTLPIGITLCDASIQGHQEHDRSQ